jgi:cell shape-determining protein MreC
MPDIFSIEWLKDSGISILIIIAIAAAVYFVLRHLIPVIIKQTMAQHMKGRLEEDIKKRSNTLSSVLIKASYHEE